ncbi:hypothetical protein Hanom_Chr08g00712031 [Helianthus anomalus]
MAERCWVKKSEHGSGLVVVWWRTMVRGGVVPVAEWCRWRCNAGGGGGKE